MKFDPAIHHRRSIRLRDYDYSSAGAYFITICVQNRAPLFGKIIDSKMHVNDAGQMVTHWYMELEKKFPEIECDEFICMPNHVHFIVHIIANKSISVGADLCVRPSFQPHPNHGQNQKPENEGGHGKVQGEHTGSPLHRVVQWFKTMTTNEYMRSVEKLDWPPFDKKLWQRNYWEHVIRNDGELTEIQTYIQSNPAGWTEDALYAE